MNNPELDMDKPNLSIDNLNVAISREDQVVIVELEGHLDGTNSTLLHQHIESQIDAYDRAMILNLEKLTYISSAGLRVMLMIAKTLHSQKAELAVCALSEPIREVFVISGFNQIIPVYPSHAEALDAVSPR